MYCTISMSKFSTGLLVLTSPLHTLPLRISTVLRSAAQIVDQTLYVSLHPDLNLGSGSPPHPVFFPPVVGLSSLISRLYSNTADVCSHLDLRVLLANMCTQPASSSGNKTSCPFPTPQPLSHSPDVVLTDFPIHDPGHSPLVAQHLKKYASRCYTCSPGLTSVLLYPRLEDQRKGVEVVEHEAESLETYTDVVVGGTFDRLHGAHKTLLATACLLANRRVLTGVCDQDMLKRKVLRELIQPYSVRVQRLREFLQDTKPSLKMEIVPLHDPLGSSVVDPELQCIVVSEETRKGGEAINKRRVENGLPSLTIHEIQLLKDFHHTEKEEEKISSSNLRSRLLGSLLAPPKRMSHLPDIPYVIGLAGGSGSGKTSVAKRLEALGAVHVDADWLAHETYRPGAAAYQRVLEEFGPDILNEDKTINRRTLGRKVFGNKERLKALTDIVWPEVERLVKDRIRQAREECKQVCVIDAAVLLDAGWADMVHEVWITIVPEEEAALRITKRDGLSREEAERRVESQGSSTELLKHANVVLCTQWEPEVTQKQVLKAWNLLHNRILQRTKVHCSEPHDENV